MAALVDFRAGLFRCLTGWADATFELYNQAPSHPRPMSTPTRLRRHGHSTFRHEPSAMRADDAKRHLAVVVGDLLGAPLALVAVPTGDVDA
jgi:hypothetical protein